MTSPPRIASLISSATEMLYLLGLGEQVVGVSHECDYPPQVAARPRLTRSLVDAAASSRTIDEQVRELSAAGAALYEIDVEQLAALYPDLIVTQAQCDVCAVRYEDVMSAVHNAPELANTRVVALNPMSLADVFADIERIAVAAGAADGASRVVAALQARVDVVRQKTESLSAAQRPRVACLEWIDPPMLAANWMPQLIDWAGGRCELTRGGAHSSYARWEDILQFDPQVIVILPCGFDLARSIEAARDLPLTPGWDSLSAVREDRVFAADGNAYFNRSGPRLVDSLEILAHLFHPDLFPASPRGSFVPLHSIDQVLLPKAT